MNTMTTETVPLPEPYGWLLDAPPYFQRSPLTQMQSLTCSTMPVDGNTSAAMLLTAIERSAADNAALRSEVEASKEREAFYLAATRDAQQLAQLYADQFSAQAKRVEELEAALAPFAEDRVGSSPERTVAHRLLHPARPTTPMTPSQPKEPTHG